MRHEGCLALEPVHPRRQVVVEVTHLLTDHGEERIHQDRHYHQGHQDHQDQDILHLRDRLDLLGLQDLQEEVAAEEVVGHQVPAEDAVIQGRSSPWLLT